MKTWGFKIIKNALHDHERLTMTKPTGKQLDIVALQMGDSRKHTYSSTSGMNILPLLNCPCPWIPKSLTCASLGDPPRIAVLTAGYKGLMRIVKIESMLLLLLLNKELIKTIIKWMRFQPWCHGELEKCFLSSLLTVYSEFLSLIILSLSSLHSFSFPDQIM